MKLKLIIAALLLINSVSYTQNVQNKTDNFYVDFSGVIGNYYAADVSINYIHSEKISFQFSYSRFERKDPSRPDDYHGGLAELFTFGGSNPNDQLESYSILGGAVLPYKGSKKARWNLKAGLAYSKYKEPTNYKKIDGGIIGQMFVGNYSWDIKESEGVSLIVKPELEIGVFRYFGTGLHATIIYNKDAFIVGLGLSLKFGLVRGKM